MGQFVGLLLGSANYQMKPSVWTPASQVFGWDFLLFTDFNRYWVFMGWFEEEEEHEEGGRNILVNWQTNIMTI